MAKNNVAALGVASAGIIGAGVYSYRAGSRPGVPNDAQSSRSQSEGHSESEKSSGDLSSASTSDKADNTTQSRGKARPENNTQQQNNGAPAERVDDKPKIHETRGISKMGQDVPSKKQPNE